MGTSASSHPGISFRSPPHQNINFMKLMRAETKTVSSIFIFFFSALYTQFGAQYVALGRHQIFSEIHDNE